jgi:hypothetical protein
LHGEGHEVLYANHNVYVNEGSPEEVTAFQTFYEKNNIWKLIKQLRILDLKLKIISSVIVTVLFQFLIFMNLLISSTGFATVL